jgi:hypothetical protein
LNSGPGPLAITLPANRNRGGRCGQAPLHGLRSAGIGAADDDAKPGARPLERVLIDTGLHRRRLDVAHLLGAVGERVEQKALCALARLGNGTCRRRWLARLARLLAGLLAQIAASVNDSAAADAGELGDRVHRDAGIGFERGDRALPWSVG